MHTPIPVAKMPRTQILRAVPVNRLPVCRQCLPLDDRVEIRRTKSNFLIEEFLFRPLVLLFRFCFFILLTRMKNHILFFYLDLLFLVFRLTMSVTAVLYPVFYLFQFLWVFPCFLFFLLFFNMTEPHYRLLYIFLFLCDL